MSRAWKKVAQLPALQLSGPMQLLLLQYEICMPCESRWYCDDFYDRGLLPPTYVAANTWNASCATVGGACTSLLPLLVNVVMQECSYMHVAMCEASFPAITCCAGMDSCACRDMFPAGVCGCMCRVLTLFSTAHALLPVLHGLTNHLTCTAELQVLTVV